jgi:hypothetical protein
MKTVEERKREIEKAFSQVGINPVHRTTIDGNELYIADGFISPALINAGFLIKFSVNPGEFPFGCFLTMWWSDQHKGIGSIAVFDAMHDPGYSPDEKIKMRVNSTIHLARQDFKRRKMH